ncbi:hypothetical protein BDP27DRAFT_1323659, partial [Rhodocollybia butyracea]
MLVHHTTLNYCSPVSFLQLKSSSLLAATLIVLGLVLANYYYRLSRRMTYETTAQVTHNILAFLLHLVSFLALTYIACWLIYMKYSLAFCLPADDYSQMALSVMAANGFALALGVVTYWFCEPSEIAARHAHYDGEVSVEELELYQSWAKPEFLIFVDASQFYLPAIEAAVNLRDFKTATAREDYDSKIQTLRDKIGEYRAFYINAVQTEAFGYDSYAKLMTLKRTIARSFIDLKTSNIIRPCIQPSDKDKLDGIF